VDGGGFPDKSQKFTSTQLNYSTLIIRYSSFLNLRNQIEDGRRRQEGITFSEQTKHRILHTVKQWLGPLVVPRS